VTYSGIITGKPQEYSGNRQVEKLAAKEIFAFLAQQKRKQTYVKP